MSFSRLFANRSVTSDRRRIARPAARRLSLEPLEDRRLLSVYFDWNNRGYTSQEPYSIPEYTGADMEPDDWDTPDNFNHVFGSNAEKAREVVDAALDAWEAALKDFNDGDNTVTLTIVMDTENNETGAHARTAGGGWPGDGVPAQG